MRSAAWLVLAGLTVAGCTDPEVEKRLTELENRVAAVEKGGGTAPADPKEQAAGEVLRAASEAAKDMQYDVAKAKLAELEQNYASTNAYRSSRRLASEIEIIGSDAGELDVERWFQGETSFTEGKATLLVFWELWCPHCRREVPSLQARYDKYHDQGLNMVGVTKVTKTSTDEGVAEFIKENNLTYPIAKEKGDLSAKYGVRGIPAAAVVKDGKVVWKGHPAQITDEMIAKWLGA